MIEAYSFGRMRVAGEEHAKDLIVFAPGVAGPEETVEGGWWRREGHSLRPEDLAGVDRVRPRVLVIGRGAYGRMAVPAATLEWLAEIGVEAVVLPTTAEAVERYNALAADGESVAAAVHLTC